MYLEGPIAQGELCRVPTMRLDSLEQARASEETALVQKNATKVDELYPRTDGDRK